jgi:hypothetical protein
MPEINEDDLIAESFLKIREGILNQDWKLVLEAYKDISGEELELPAEKPKTRLESIREKMGQKPVEKKERKPRAKKEKTLKTDEIEGINVVTEKVKGGKNFAKDGFQVLSVAPNEEEIKENKKRAVNKTRMARKPKLTQSKEFSYDNPDGDTRYRDRPLAGAPWS